VIIFMAGITTLLAPPILRYLFRNIEPETGPGDEFEEELRESEMG
jgi:hypothetical protein